MNNAGLKITKTDRLILFMMVQGIYLIASIIIAVVLRRFGLFENVNAYKLGFIIYLLKIFTMLKIGIKNNDIE